ncbi:MAG TPA: glycerophosphodiester phosphodiesterase family protein [Candidatus Binatia bacterium]|nr:glycerophosphodiester phosphodiesterase family protein [Candidatus Binatia bacterium]
MRRFCLLLMLASAGCGDTRSDPPAAPQVAATIVVSAHRGGSAYAPENTLEAFRNAVRLGVDQLETDTQLTADGELVLIHDATLDRTTDCSGAVNATALAAIRACDAAFWFSPGQPTTLPDLARPHPRRGRGVQVPTARELFAWLRGLGPRAPELSIEIKDIPGEANFDATGKQVAAQLVPLLQEYGLTAHTLVQSFWPAALDEVKRLDPSLRTQFLTTSSTGQTAAQNLAYAVTRGHDVVAPNFDAPDLDTIFVASAHAAGKRVIAWTADAATDMIATARLGVDGLITNFPACLLRLQNRWHGGNPGGPICPAAEPAPVAAGGDRPDEATCAALRPARWLPASGQSAPDAALRVVGIQYKQEVRHVETYAGFRTKMRCLMQDHVVPLLRPGVPMLVVFNEDIGLMTLATGTRGAALRALAQSPAGGGAGDTAPAPASAAAGLAAANAAYAPQVAAYQALYGPIDPRKQVFVAATDTFVRAFSQTFSDIARDYGVYVVASNNQPHYHASRDPADIAAFGDPELQPLDEVYVADGARVTNATFLWGPRELHPDAAAGERNLVFRNDKVPLTSIELDLLALDEGAASGPDAVANAAGASVAGFRLGFATSLPAFAWGYPLGQRPADLQPCADMHVSYMPCMDALGVEVVVQAEANPGRWAIDQAGGWQPLEWMDSTWRTVAEPTVRFRYNVTPMLTGNLLDLAFDGQSAITRRGGGGTPAHYIGDLETEAGDPAAYAPYHGNRPEFLALAPWVTADAPRAGLRATGTQLAPGSGDALENDYLETAVWADLNH